MVFTPFFHLFSMYGSLTMIVLFLSIYFGSIDALKRKPFSNDRPYWGWALFWSFFFFYFMSLTLATVAKYVLCNHVAKVRLPPR